MAEEKENTIEEVSSTTSEQVEQPAVEQPRNEKGQFVSKFSKYLNTIASFKYSHCFKKLTSTILIELSLNINGFIYGLLCDLCASEIDVKISNSLSVLLQFSQEKIEDTDEIMYVQTNQNKIDISHLIYEGVILSIPTTIKHLNESECNKETILLLKKYSEKDKRTDPRWEQLNKLKDII